MKPVQQVFALVLEEIQDSIVFQQSLRRTEKYREKLVPEKFLKEQSIRNKQIKQLIFEEYLVICENMRRCQLTLKNMKFSILNDDITSVIKKKKPTKAFDIEAFI